MAKQRRPQSLSPAEWRIMHLCWRLGRSTAREIYEASLEAQDRDYQTVKTLLDRIAAKGYLSIEKVGPLCVYKPVRQRRKAIAEAIDRFIDTVLERTPQPLVAYLARREDLAEEERELLREILARHESGEADSDG